MKQELMSIVLGTSLAFSSIFGIANAQIIEGRDYKKLSVTADRVAPDNGKIEIVEVFSYTCGFCFQFEPAISTWLKSKDDRIEFVQMAMPGERMWGFFAQVFYTLETMKELEKGHIAAFEAVHVKNLRMQTKEQAAEYFANYKINQNDFIKTWDSFPVRMKMGRAENIVKEQYQLSHTPVLIVNGQYMVDAAIAGGYDKTKSPYENMLFVAETLAKKIADEKK